MSGANGAAGNGVDDTSQSRLKDDRWDGWTARGILLARGDEVYLIEAATSLLVADALAWGYTFYEELKQVTSKETPGTPDRIGFYKLSKEERHDRLAALESWLEDPEANADRIDWAYPLAFRQKVLPDVLTVVTHRDLNRLIDAIIAHSFSRISLHPIPGMETPPTAPISVRKMQQIIKYAKASLNKGLTSGRGFSSVEWVLNDGQSHPLVTGISEDPVDLFVYGKEPRLHSHRALPMLYASERISGETAHHGPLLAAVTRRGDDAEFLDEAARAILENALERADAP